MVQKTKIMSLRPVRGVTADQIGSEALKASSTPDLLSCIHPGQVVPSDSDAWSQRGYRAFHPLVSQDFGDPNAGPVIDESLMMRGGYSEIRLCLWVSGIFHSTEYKGKDESYADAREKSPVGLASTTFSLEQLDDSGSWSEVAAYDGGDFYDGSDSIKKRVEIPFVITNRQGGNHLGFINWLQLTDRIDGDYREFDDDELRPFVPREGMLTESDIADRAWSEIVISITDLDGIDLRYPVRAIAELGIDHGAHGGDNDFPYFDDPDMAEFVEPDENGIDYPARRRMFLKLIGYSMWGIQ